MNDDENSDFSELMPDVKRLKTDRINVYKAPKRSEATIRAVAKTPNFDAASVPASSPARDSYFNSGLQTKLQQRIRKGLIRPDASLDLHGYREIDAIPALQDFFSAALAEGLRLVLVIHGQGYRSQRDAVLKPLLQRWLANQSEVLAWCPAQRRDGAGGASYVYLRKR